MAVAARSHREVAERTDGFTTIFGSRRGVGDREVDRRQSEKRRAHNQALPELAELTFSRHEHRMGWILDNLSLGARASRVWEHQQTLHLWPEGNSTWLSPWGQRVTFACGLTVNLRPKQRAITHMWTRVPAWERAGRANGRSLCPDCQAHAHEFPELSTSDEVVDGSLDVCLPAAEIAALKHAFQTALDEAAEGWTLKTGYLDSERVSALAASALKSVFVPWASTHAHASQEYVVGRSASASWMRDHKDTLEASLGADWWLQTVDSLWEGPAQQGNGRTQKAYWRLLAQKVRLKKSYMSAIGF